MDNVSHKSSTVWSLPAILLAVLLCSAVARGSIVPCVGDCASDEEVTVDDLIKGVNIALGTAVLESCPPFDLAGVHACDGCEMPHVECVQRNAEASRYGCRHQVHQGFGVMKTKRFHP